MTQPILFKNAQLWQPGRALSAPQDVRIQDGVIAAIGTALPAIGTQVIDATGQMLAPGFCDLRACAREPGDEHEEDLQSLSETAAAGGFTAVVVGPDTTPGNDDHAVTELILRRAREYGRCDVLPQGALSHRLKGETLAPMGEMAEAGAVCFGDGDRPVISGRLLRRALEYAGGFGRPIFVNPIDPDLAGHNAASPGHSAVHEGPWSTRLGLRGIPSAAEHVAVARDIAVCHLAGGRLHFARVTSAKSVALIRQAKAEGIQVTVAVTPWHLRRTVADLVDYDVNLKLVAPLRDESDRQALLAGLADGTIDAICSDHMPVNIAGKALEFDYAAPGAIGLQTTWSDVMACVHAGEIALDVALTALTTGPRKVLGLPAVTVQLGAVADLTLLAPDAEWTLDAGTNRSRSRNTVHWGKVLRGQVLATVFRGHLVHQFRA